MIEEQSIGEMTASIKAAQHDLLEKARSEPDRWWDAQALRAAAQNGHPGDVMMFALTDLVNRGSLLVDSRLHVKATPSQ